MRSMKFQRPHRRRGAIHDNFIPYGVAYCGLVCYGGAWYGYGIIALTMAMEQYTKAVFATDTRNKLPVLFQLKALDSGTAIKAGMARRQPVRCHTVMPSILMTRGNTTSCRTAAIKPATRKT